MQESSVLKMYIIRTPDPLLLNICYFARSLFAPANNESTIKSWFDKTTKYTEELCT